MEEELILKLKKGSCYILRNGLETSPLRLSKDGTNYIFEADVQEPQYDTKSVLCWLRSGRHLTNNIENRFDVVKEKEVDEKIHDQ